MCKYKIIDLFAGAGGLSYGFLQTDKFEIKLAVEIDANAQKTYKENHKNDNNDNIEIKSNIQDVDFIDVKRKYGSIDFVIGGPPCQGFSNANRQRNTLISNNNKLVKEYIRAIECLKPKGFVLENVKTMKSSKHKFYLSNKDLKDEIIISKSVKIQDERIAIANSNELVNNCFDNIVLCIKSHDDFNKYKLNEKLLSFFRSLLKKSRSKIDMNSIMYQLKCPESKWLENHISYISEKYKTEFLNIRNNLLNKNSEEMLSSIVKVLEIQKIVYKISEIQNNDIILDDFYNDYKYVYLKLRSYNIFDYVTRRLESVGYELKDFILDASDYGVPQFRNRLIVIGIKKKYLKEETITEPEKIIKDECFTIKDAISDLEVYENSFNVEGDKGIKRRENNKLSKLQKYLCDSKIIRNLIITETRKEAMERFKVLKQGENFHDLNDDLKQSYANPERTQSSIYKRLDYKKPAGTVTNVRKAMWIHPVINRAISVREAARLQSFPDSFVFYGKKDSQYQQIGNAVPPMLARAIAEKVLELIGDKPKEYLRNKINF